MNKKSNRDLDIDVIVRRNDFGAVAERQFKIVGKFAVLFIGWFNLQSSEQKHLLKTHSHTRARTNTHVKSRKERARKADNLSDFDHRKILVCIGIEGRNLNLSALKKQTR